MLERQAVVIAGGVSLVILGLLAGASLSVNLLLSMIYAQREAFAVTRALGMGRGMVIGVAVVQAVVIAMAGTMIGLAATPFFAAGLNSLAVAVTGFDGLVVVPTAAYVAGVGVAAVFGMLGGSVGAWRITRASAVEQVLD